MTTPSRVRARRGKRPATLAPRSSRRWRRVFLAALAETSHVTQAAAAARISLSHVYKLRRDDAGFARAWFAALCEGYDNLEMDLLHRLRRGESRDDSGARKFDNASALRLLAAHRESAARERARREDDSEEAILASLNAKLDAMREAAQARARGDNGDGAVDGEADAGGSADDDAQA